MKPCPTLHCAPTGTTATDTDQCWAASSCAGSWWWVSWWRPCPGWSWHCGAAAAAGPARRKPPTPSRVDIARRPWTSPSSAPSSLCGRQVVGQTQPCDKLASPPYWLQSVLSHWGARLQQLESALSELQARLDPPSDSFTYVAITGHLIGCWPSEIESTPLKWLAGRAGTDSLVCLLVHSQSYSVTPIIVTFTSLAQQIYKEENNATGTNTGSTHKHRAGYMDKYQDKETVRLSVILPQQPS